ncbi:MAG: transcriptional repressor [Comamonas sp.]
MERNTRQRNAIQTAIDEARRPLSPQEVLDAAQRDVPGMGIATVYRNLKSMLEAGAIELVVLPGDNPRYESRQAAQHHHHHFQCRACARVFDVPGCVAGYEQLAPAGFTVEGHELTLYGLCADCAATAGERAPVACAEEHHHHHGHHHS